MKKSIPLALCAILPAFACGATIVATAFRNAIESAEFAGAFDRIVFAIKPDHNDPDGKNVREFAAAFS